MSRSVSTANSADSIVDRAAMIASSDERRFASPFGATVRRARLTPPATSIAGISGSTGCFFPSNPWKALLRGFAAASALFVAVVIAAILTQHVPDRRR